MALSKIQTPLIDTTTDLGDYEEGSWNVTYHDASSGGNTSNTSTTGYYVKIGRQVTAIFTQGNIDSTGMTGSGNFYFSLPYTASSQVNLYTGSVRLYANVADSTVSLCSQINAGNSRGVMTESRDAAALDNPIWADFVDDATDLSISITYFVDN